MSTGLKADCCGSCLHTPALVLQVTEYLRAVDKAVELDT